MSFRTAWSASRLLWISLIMAFTPAHSALTSVRLALIIPGVAVRCTLSVVFAACQADALAFGSELPHRQRNDPTRSQLLKFPFDSFGPPAGTPVPLSVARLPFRWNSACPAADIWLS